MPIKRIKKFLFVECSGKIIDFGVREIWVKTLTQPLYQSGNLSVLFTLTENHTSILENGTDNTQPICL